MLYSELTPEQKAELKAQLEAEERQTEERRKAEKETYKSLADDFVARNFKKLTKVSTEMLSVKQAVFEDSETLLKMKSELFNVRSNQQSHTFTTCDGKYSVKLGNRVNEGWDETVEAGIEKVKEYIRTLARDENSAMLVDTVMGLLAKDRKGALKASKVLELEKLAGKSNNPLFNEGIKIIKEAYRPEPTCQFIEVKYKDDKGTERSLPLSMSAVDY